MVTKDIKISKLLKEYPGSLEVLLKASPHFSKLQNKLLRKALAGRVTVEQAASIAGVDLGDLLQELNNSVVSGSGKDVFAEENKKVKNDWALVGRDAAPTADKPEHLKSLTSDKIFYLDVRPIIDSGKDPLKDILLKVKVLKRDEVLVIINSFEPIPLYSLLSGKGFSHWTEKTEDVFKVFFYKNNVETNNSELARNKEGDLETEITENNFQNIIEIDVRELQPPEPMMKILENLYRIDEKSVMIVYHHREPHLLYPRLEERGYMAVCNKVGENNYKILIVKKAR